MSKAWALPDIFQHASFEHFSVRDLQLLRVKEKGSKRPARILEAHFANSADGGTHVILREPGRDTTVLDLKADESDDTSSRRLTGWSFGGTLLKNWSIRAANEREVKRITKARAVLEL